MVKIPAGSDVVASEAIPPLSDPVPRTAEPFLKVMVSPFGGGPALELKVAVNVTASPTRVGLSDETNVVVVGLPLGCCSAARPRTHGHRVAGLDSLPTGQAWHRR